jgi:uncharacterized protein YxjI
MGTRDVVGGVDFSGESFVIKSGLVGVDYAIKSESGERLLTTERKFFADNMTYVYKDDADEERFRYGPAEDGPPGQAFQFVDVTGETPPVTLSRADPESSREWVIDAGSRNGAIHVASKSSRIPLLASQPGENMEVTDAAGERLGSVSRRILAIHFTFDVELPGVEGVPKAATLLAVPMLYDLMQERSVPWELGRD